MIKIKEKIKQGWQWCKTKTKTILISLGIVGVAIAAGAVISNPPIPAELQLKASKERIWKSEVQNDIRCNEKRIECVNYGLMKKYWYVKNDEIIPQKIDEVFTSDELKNLKIKNNLTESRRDYNLIEFDLGERKRATVFYVGIQFVKEKTTGKWFHLETATTTIEMFDKQVGLNLLQKIIVAIWGEKVFATTSTFYPDPDTETTSVDGNSIRTDEATWAGAHDATAGTAGYGADNGAQAYAGESRMETSAYRISRGFFLFDTSAIPDTDTINSATLSLYVYYLANTDNDGE
ncbi:MAG: hypothetical protein ABID61_01925, partial [Candidatus Micrarchaeota archaeon]